MQYGLKGHKVFYKDFECAHTTNVQFVDVPVCQEWDYNYVLGSANSSLKLKLAIIVNYSKHLAPVVQRVNSTIHRINHCPVDSVWSFISAKNRSLYSILDLLYFMLPYTMRNPTVLISWLNLSIVHGIFCFSHSISQIWHAKLTIFCCLYKKSTMQVSTFEVLFSTSMKFMYSASFDILPQSIERGHRGCS